MSEQQKYRLITRSDFDGLVCAMLLKELDMIEDILFVQPKDMQDGKIAVTQNDISTNLPYTPGLYLSFDHHGSESVRLKGEEIPEHINDPTAPSVARVVYRHFGGESRFPHERWQEVMQAVDKADSAQFDDEDVLYPKGWMLMNFLMDPRTGLGRFREFTISNYQLMMNLIDYCRQHTIEEVLALPDVKERVDYFFEQEEMFKNQIQLCTKIHGNLAVVDLRGEEQIFPGNRFMVYALYPQCNISMHILWGIDRKKTVFALGKSIFNRDSKTHVGKLCLKYGGGGHQGAGTCQVETETAFKVRNELIAQINRDG
ncbi:MAG: exopolyphosphatase [Magnetococcales bacterium]|nr:exopolyphosphatase [Magnetococcales bacterium]